MEGREREKRGGRERGKRRRGREEEEEGRERERKGEGGRVRICSTLPLAVWAIYYVLYVPCLHQCPVHYC